MKKFLSKATVILTTLSLATTTPVYVYANQYNEANTNTQAKAIVQNGLCKATDGKWYYYKNNKVDTTYTGMAKNSYGWWYVKKGKLDTTYTGMAKNDYGWFYMTNGKLDTKYTGMAKNKYGWWYITKGKLDTTYTGVAKNQYGLWYIKNGKLDTTYTGVANTKNTTYFVTYGSAVPRVDVSENKQEEYIVDLGNKQTTTVKGCFNTAYEDEVIRLVNEYRAENGLNPLEKQTILSDNTDIRGYEISNLFSHTRPNGLSCFSVLDNCGYWGMGENIAVGQRTPEAVMNAWKNSPGHNANMLNPNWKYIGVSTFQTNTGYGIYWVQMFGR